MTVTLQQLEDVVVVSEDAHGSPFAGLTLAKARVLNAALSALPVEVYGGRENGGRPDVFIFRGITLPSEWVTIPFLAVGDLRLEHAELIDGTWMPCGHSTRVLSAGLVRRFDVLAREPQFNVCSVCGKTMPLHERVYDMGSLGPEWGQRLECEECWQGAW